MIRWPRSRYGFSFAPVMAVAVSRWKGETDRMGGLDFSVRKPWLTLLTY